MQRLSEGYCVLAVVLLVAALSSACRNTGGGFAFRRGLRLCGGATKRGLGRGGPVCSGRDAASSRGDKPGGGLLGRRVVVRAMDDRPESEAALATTEEIGKAIER